jgi:phosphoribosylglycinamide formyltransferase-1
MRYAFYISGKSARLQKSLLQFGREILSEIVLIISDAELSNEFYSFLKNYCVNLKIIDDKKLNGTRKEKNLKISDFILKNLRENSVDYCFSFGSHILCGDLLEIYKNRMINFHPAILPMFPGRKSIDQAVNFGNVLLVGNSAHFIDEGMDTGTIIMQSVIPIKSFTDTNNYDVVLDLQIEMLNQLIRVLDENRLKIHCGKAVIVGADYSYSALFPKISWGGGA